MGGTTQWDSAVAQELQHWAATRASNEALSQCEAVLQKLNINTPWSKEDTSEQRERHQQIRSESPYPKRMKSAPMRSVATPKEQYIERNDRVDMTSYSSTIGNASMAVFQDAARKLRSQPMQSLANFSEWGESLKAGNAKVSNEAQTTSEAFLRATWNDKFSHVVDNRRKRVHRNIAEQREYFYDLFDDATARKTEQWLLNASPEEAEPFIDAFRTLHVVASQRYARAPSRSDYKFKRPGSANRAVCMEQEYNKQLVTSSQNRAASQARAPEADEAKEEHADGTQGSEQQQKLLLQPSRGKEDTESAIAGTAGAPYIKKPDVQEAAAPIQQTSGLQVHKSTYGDVYQHMTNSPTAVLGNKRRPNSADSAANVNFGSVQYLGMNKPRGKRAYAVSKGSNYANAKFDDRTSNRRSFKGFSRSEAEHAGFDKSIADILKPSEQSARMPFGPIQETDGEIRSRPFSASTTSRETFREPNRSSAQLRKFRTAVI